MKIARHFFLLLITLGCYSTLIAQSHPAKPKALLNHVAIFVVNLEKTKAFYRDVFQLDTIPEPFHDGKHTWYSIAPGVSMHVIQGADKPKEYYQNNHICFSVSNTPDFVEKLRELGLSWFNASGVKSQITTRIDGVKQVWITDPDGYWLEINDAK
ncbi:MAG: VOC family protein [Sediminibacterium sp.]|nr:VOC family protein [Sediminibacterium sp.]MDP3666017.1 VOC family protein [Sediminibacterium sp.]